MGNEHAIIGSRHAFILPQNERERQKTRASERERLRELIHAVGLVTLFF